MERASELCQIRTDSIRNWPLVSVIIVNWNGKRYLKGCLDALARQTYPNYEIIMVDNGSTDDSARYVQEHYANLVRVIESPKNLGFGAGNNLGIRAARGEFIAILNNDTEADPYWLEAMVRAALQDRRVGMVAPKILFHAPPHLIDSVGMVIYRDAMSRGRGHQELDRGQYDQQEEVLLPSGCAALYRREMLEQIGLFEEDYFMYCEDTDLGLRGRLAGWKCVSAPEAIVYHLYSASSGRYSAMKALLVERNHVWLALKILPWTFFVTSPFYTIARFALQAYGAIRRSGSAGRIANEVPFHRLVLIVAQAYWQAFRGLPAILRKRRLVQKTKAVSNAEIRNWFRRFGMTAREIALKD